MDKVVGVLGGMGPEATHYFFDRVVALTPAQVDQDHLHIIIDNNPKIPDRTQAILGNGESPLPEMIHSIKNLEKCDVNFIVIPCNAAHYFFQQLQKITAVPMINLLSEVVAEVMKLTPAVKTVGILAATGTIAAGVYQQEFHERGISVIVPDENEQKEVMAIIYGVKGGEKGEAVEKRLKALSENLITKGAEALILGCTELSLFYHHMVWKIPVIDSVEVLAQVTVQEAKEGR